MKKLLIFGFVATLSNLQGCDYNSLASPVNDTVCEVATTDAKEIAEKCTKGERILFAPSSWGNEQLPVLFSSLYCNHKYAIALTKGGVSCIYSPVDFNNLFSRTKTE